MIDEKKLVSVLKNLNEQDGRLVELVKLSEQKTDIKLAKVFAQLDKAEKTLEELKPLLEYVREKMEEERAEIMAKSLKGE